MLYCFDPEVKYLQELPDRGVAMELRNSATAGDSIGCKSALSYLGTPPVESAPARVRGAIKSDP